MLLVIGKINRSLSWAFETEKRIQLDLINFQATSNCHAAKAHLEMIYQNLSQELDQFDYQKEKELREIFVDYTTLRAEHYEKVITF